MTTKNKLNHPCGYWPAALLVVALACAPAAAQTTHLVGPDDTPASARCGASDCDFTSVQAAIDAAVAGDTITVYRNLDSVTGQTNNDCYEEHVVIDKDLTVQGASKTPADAACIGPKTGGEAIVLISASGVTFKDLDISGKSNNGAGGLNGKGSGGRSSGYGILVSGDDVDGVVIDNCSVSFSRLDLIRWDGDQDDDGNGEVTVRNCYLHHSDLPKHNIRIIGGSSATDVHLIEDNLMNTGQGIATGAGYITVRKNVIVGWSYWGHLLSNGSWPETHDYNSQSANYGGGWRYFSRCPAGVYVQNGGAGTDITINNNLIIGTRIGIRVQTTGTISNNTVVNPFNTRDYTYNDSISAADIRDQTFGIQIVSGFSGAIKNNIVAVTDDNRATGQPGKATAPYYTPGITGYGIGFFGGGGILAGGASVAANNVWGFVDTDGSTATNWGAGLTSCGDNTDAECSNNISVEPGFASDTSDETNDGGGGCDADADDLRCFELYYDNFFLKTDRPSGGCHADIRPNTAGYVGFVDMTSSSDLAGLGPCEPETDGAASVLIDYGDGSVSGEDGNHGSFINLGAFGDTDRASESPMLKIVRVSVGSGGVKDSSLSYFAPGLIQPGADGLTELNIYFNRSVVATSSSFEIRDHCDNSDLTAPTFDFSGASTAPFVVTMTWPADTLENQWVRIHVLADDPVNKIVDSLGEALDGEISDVEDGTLPSGDSTAGGDAQFVVGALEGDTDGDAE